MNSTAPKDGGAVFVVPLSGAHASGPIAVWLLAAGWAESAENRLGNSLLITPQGLLTAEEARHLASRPALGSRAGAGSRSSLERLFRTLAKDLRGIVWARRFRSETLRVDRMEFEPDFVWQHHQAFHDAGFRLARRFGCPLVLHVDAPIVWESRRWGVTRPGWGRLIERYGELPQMLGADLVTCPSDEVAEQVRHRGVPTERVLVTPGGVDVHAFHPGVSGESMRQRYGLRHKMVVGWTGSFRRFHGLNTAIEAFADLQRQRPATALLMVGDGFERPALERRAHGLGLRDVVFTGTVAHDAMPQHIAAMDVGLVLAPVAQGFHYSPMKLREYLSCGLPVVAARIGETERMLSDGREALLVPPNDAGALARALLRLYDDPSLRRSLGDAGREMMLAEGSWDRQLARVLEALA